MRQFHPTTSWLSRILCAAMVATTGAMAAENNSADKPLRIMLQGASSSAMRQLVEQHGGVVTHDLHIINAVGADVTAPQLQLIREAPGISRIIDDLSVEAPEPLEPAPSQDCDVGGALEARLAADSMQWTLYNKHTEAAKLEKLSFSWPAALGALTGLTLGDQELTREHQPSVADDSFTLSVSYPETSAPTLVGNAVLKASFTAPLIERGDHRRQQRDFQLHLEFQGKCKTELIPGYPDYAADTYYPSVAGAADLHQLGVTGRGVTVAVLDSGLWEHPALANDTRGNPRILGRYDAIANKAEAEVFDDSGHGTHMTSVIAHSGQVRGDNQSASGSFKGIAPDANLVAVKAFDDEGQGDFLDIVRGVQWIVDNRERLDIKVLNLSFAARPRWPYFLDPINQALMRAWAAGITVVAAAGNEGPDAMTIGSPGNLPYLITVGAVTDSWTIATRDDDYIPDFSSRGPTPSGHIKPDIVAPGGHIAGIVRPGSALTRKHPDYMISTGELVMTGTSQASALVAGIAALLLQLEPDLQPDDIKCKLISSAELAINRDGRLAYSPFQQGNGYVNAGRAVTLGQRGCGNQEMNIAVDIAGMEYVEGPAIVDDEGNASLPGLDKMLSPSPSAEGHSDNRRWGAKEHIERPNPLSPDPELPFDWLQVYLAEKATMESLSAQPIDNERVKSGGEQ